MASRRATTAPAAIVGALGLTEDALGVRRLLDALGGDPVAVRERDMGEPAVRTRRLLLASGGEIVVHDGVVVAVLLRVAPTLAAPHGVDLATWMPGLDRDATLVDLERALGARPRFAGIGSPWFDLHGTFARADFAGDRGWRGPGALRTIAFTRQQPGLASKPDDDDCPTCSDLLQRSSDGALDVDRTVDALESAASAGLLDESLHRVRLADLRPLRASGLMERVESHLACTTCGRILCLALHRDGPATVDHLITAEAMRRPLERVPPVEEWGDAARIAAGRDGMHLVDHEPGSWFLLSSQGELYLDARYSYSAIIDDSALVRLDDAEAADHRARGHAAIDDLAQRIHMSAPYSASSSYRPRDLYRGPDARTFREAVMGAIFEHTWIAEQHRAGGATGSRAGRDAGIVSSMSDTISGSIGDPTASDPDFATDPETEEPVADGPDGVTDDGSIEPEEYASPTV